MRRSVLSAALGLAMTGQSVLGIGGAPAALATDERAAGPGASSPMLEALALLPSDIDAFEFTDWSALQALHGGSDIGSGSPLAERQRLMLDIANDEVAMFPIGLDRLGTWSERWGWDTTDLEWQASCCGAPDFAILRFREAWDAEPFMARLVADGYERKDKPHAVSFTLEPGTPAPDRDFLERVLSTEGAMGAAPMTRASVAISPDGHTVVLVSGPDAHKVLRRAARADPGAIADSPIGRTATALGSPLAASIRGGRYSCPPMGSERGYSDENDRLMQEIGPLHPYQTFGMGYERAGPGEPAVGRYVFGYDHAGDANADLPGRRRLIDEGVSVRYGAPYRDSVFTLVDAVVEGRQLILEVAPVGDRPQVLIDTIIGRDMIFASCS